MLITAGDICSIAGWKKSNHKDDFIWDWLTENQKIMSKNCFLFMLSHVPRY